jgi:hypothetical protein
MVVLGQATSDPWPIHLQVTLLCSHLCHPVAYSFFHIGATNRRHEVVGGGLEWTPSRHDTIIFFGFLIGDAPLGFSSLILA